MHKEQVTKDIILEKVEVRDYNVIVDRTNVFDQAVKNDKITYENIRKIATGQGDDFITGCSWDYPYFKDSCKMIAID